MLTRPAPFRGAPWVPMEGSMARAGRLSSSSVRSSGRSWLFGGWLSLSLVVAAVAGVGISGWRQGAGMSEEAAWALMVLGLGLLVVAAEVTPRLRGHHRDAEADLERHRRDDRHLAAIVSASADAMMSMSLDGTLTSWNAGAEAMFGYPASEVIGEHFEMLARPNTRELRAGFAEVVLAGRSVVGAEGIGVHKDRTEFPVSYTVSPIRHADETVIGLSAVARDITAQKALEATLEHRALHDGLTGLPNRVVFVDRVTLSLARLPRHLGVVGVVFVDVDQFKVINDSLGHDQGDRLLVLIAERLSGAVRPGDTVARFGGDEFAVLCDDLADDAEATAIGERIQRAAAGPFVLDGRNHYVTVSAGIATTASAAVVAVDLLREADFAMYHAKDAGRARSVIFAEAMRTRAGSTRPDWSSRSPKASSWPAPAPPSPCCAASNTSASASASTTSGPATPRSATSRSSPSTS